ncbi:factor VIII intron 22 protein [Diachasma alloeum]|uniref:factor VIII intron 22 protein n=1 Tax=Diachasma alloeum TaxID=454923 RepID=UPI0007383A90|nr:factor VIII intron 22 protein [Diachasma alloeum]
MDNLLDNTDLRQNNHFLIKYHSINNKLKKRFLRNPNITEASEQFNSLALHCEQEEAWQYAGLCLTSVGRCYHTLGDTESEINNLLRAGRHFLAADKQNWSIGCPSLGQENFQAATSCFSEALQACQNAPEFNSTAAGSMLELAMALGPTPAAGQLVKKSIGIFPTAQAFDLLMSYYIKQGDYSSALNLSSEFMDLLESSVASNHSAHYRIFIRKIEINRLLLILIQQLTVQRLSPGLSEVLERFTSIEDNWSANTHMSEDEFILLQSLVLACQSKDNYSLLALENDLWKFLDTEQKDLLRILVKIVTIE